MTAFRRNAQAAPHLHRGIVNDKDSATSGYRPDADLAAELRRVQLLEEALVLDRALGDPRLSAANKNPQVVAERHALADLYERAG